MNIAAICPVGAGVFHHRIYRPHTKMNTLGYAECTTINDYVEDIEALKDYDLVIYHTAITQDPSDMPSAIARLKSWGVRVVMDIDDYWRVEPTHALYRVFKEKKREENTIMQMGMADAVICATPYLAKLAKRHNKNAFALANSIDFDEPQYKPQPDHRLKSEDRVYYGMVTGSSHKSDVRLIEGLWNPINAKYRGEFGTVLAGYNLGGEQRVLTYLTEGLAEDLTKYNLFTKNTVAQIAKAKGRIDKILPSFFSDKYGSQLKLQEIRRPMQPKQNVWYYYEQVLTGNFSTITDYRHIQHLHAFEEKHFDNGDMEHIRLWTRPASEYAKNYSAIDISIAPLLDNTFNRCKSNLKLLEAGAHKKAVVASKIEPYLSNDPNDADWHGQKLFLVGEKRKRDWAKFLSKLIDSEQLRVDMGESLHEWVKEHYDMDKVCEIRAEAYDKILKL